MSIISIFLLGLKKSWYLKSADIKQSAFLKIALSIAKLPEPASIATFLIFLFNNLECLKYFKLNLSFKNSKKL